MKNAKPEKITQFLVYNWAMKNNFWIHVIESKATYSVKAGRYLRGNAPEGFSDLVGLTPKGQACFIELKAHGKRANLSLEQTLFLFRAIYRGAFAACVDSPVYLQQVYETYISLSEKEKKPYLYGLLPLKKHETELSKLASREEYLVLEQLNQIP